MMTLRGTVRRALIVDDDGERRVHMCEGLLDHGVASDQAASVAEAIWRLCRSHYDLVVCDMVLVDPPGSDDAAPRGYLVACFALARPQATTVVQASVHQRWAHPGSVLTNWSVSEVVDLIYGGPGIPLSRSADGGCPWLTLRRLAAAPSCDRLAGVRELLALPILAELDGSPELPSLLRALEDAAGGLGDWSAALGKVREALFPGADGS